VWRGPDQQFSVIDLRVSKPVPIDRASLARALTTTTVARDGLLIQR
jgi:hypothetical protein